MLLGTQAGANHGKEEAGQGNIDTHEDFTPLAIGGALLLLQHANILPQLPDGHLLRLLLLPRNLLRRKAQGNDLLCKFGSAGYALLVIQSKDIAIDNAPGAVFPIALTSSLNAGNTTLVEFLNGNIRHLAFFLIKFIGISNSLSCATDSFDDDMLLSGGSGVMLNLFVQNTP